MASITVLEIDAFTHTPGKGNRAGVVVPEDDRLSDESMSRIAREVGHSETAFVRPWSGSSGELFTDVRFFTRSGAEVPMCGHATLATNHFLASKWLDRKPSAKLTIRQKSKAGEMKIIATTDGAGVLGPLELQMGSIPVGERIIYDRDIFSALGVRRPFDAIPTAIAGIDGARFILADVGSLSAVNELTPDLDRIAQLSWTHHTIGVMAYMHRRLQVSKISDQEHLMIVSRVFVPAVGIPEDPVTGMANAALAAFLHSSGQTPVAAHGNSRFIAVQGLPGRRGLLEIEAFDEPNVTAPRISIRGAAVIASERSVVH